MTTTYTNATSTLAEIMGLEAEARTDKAESGLDNDLDVSPVTLSSAWSRVARLLLLSSMAVGGSVGNVFMISAVVVEDQLKKRGLSTSILSFPQESRTMIITRIVHFKRTATGFQI